MLLINVPTSHKLKPNEHFFPESNLKRTKEKKENKENKYFYFHRFLSMKYFMLSMNDFRTFKKLTRFYYFSVICFSRNFCAGKNMFLLFLLKFKMPSTIIDEGKRKQQIKRNWKTK